MSENVLKVTDLRVAYGGIQAVKGIDLEVNKGELVTLIGGNGSGKSTVLKAITGSLEDCTVEGDIRYWGQPVSATGSFRLADHNIAMVPEGRGVLTRMTVHENLLMGAYVRDDQEGIAADIDRWFDTFPRLKERASQLAGTLSGGEQQMLALARALMSKPELLLLDEPSMGLSPAMVERIFEVVRDVSEQGVTILMIEQNALVGLEAADRAYVMDTGLIAVSGNAKELLVDPKVKVAYLGEG